MFAPVNRITVFAAPLLFLIGNASAQDTIPLISSEIVLKDWTFNNGREFPGATGSLAIDPESKLNENDSLKLVGDFTKGGGYVQAGRKIEPGEDWQRIELPLERFFARRGQADAVTSIAKYESWGGAKDGAWHGPPRQLVISLTTCSNPPNHQPEILLADIRAEALLPVFAQPSAFKSQSPIILSRTLEEVETPRSMVSPAFAAAPGQWEIRFNSTADLNSPDNSYNGVLNLECLDAGGEAFAALTVADVFGKQKSKLVSKVVELPANTASARFQAKLNKAWGEFRIDDLSAAFLALAPRRDDRIERLLFSTAQLGNLLFPEDSREVGVTTDPMLLLYKDSAATLANEFEASAATFAEVTETIARDSSTVLTVNLATVSVDDVKLSTPPFWNVERSEEESKNKSVRFTVTPPEHTAAREGEFHLGIGDGAGELSFRAPLSE